MINVWYSNSWTSLRENVHNRLNSSFVSKSLLSNLIKCELGHLEAMVEMANNMIASHMYLCVQLMKCNIWNIMHRSRGFRLYFVCHLRGAQFWHMGSNKHIILYATPFDDEGSYFVVKTLHVKIMYAHLCSPFSMEIWGQHIIIISI